MEKNMSITHHQFKEIGMTYDKYGVNTKNSFNTQPKENKMKLTHNQVREISSRDRFMFSPTYKEKKRLAYVRRAVKQAEKDRDNERLALLSEAQKAVKPTIIERFAETGVWLAIGIILGMWLR
jgi:hypothetical protein